MSPEGATERPKSPIEVAKREIELHTVNVTDLNDLTREVQAIQDPVEREDQLKILWIMAIEERDDITAAQINVVTSVSDPFEQSKLVTVLENLRSTLALRKADQSISSYFKDRYGSRRSN